MSFRLGIIATALIAFLALTTRDAVAEQRVSLVIGNASYKNANRLANPANDSAAIADLFRNAGFDVVHVKQDLGIREMRRVIRDFSDMTRDADIAVVYYAGHGMEVDGSNYLIPVDAALERDIDVEDEGLSLDRVLKVLEPAKRLRLVILDACRDNPFTKTMKRTLASRTIGRGLAQVEPTVTDTLIAFAAKAGSTASDGAGRHSPFTAALLKHITEPGLDLRLAFGRVRDEVLKTTAHKQEPFVYGSLGGTTVSLAPERKITVAPVIQSQPSSDPNAALRRDYELAAQVGTKEAWDSFLATHPKGFYADLARAQRAKILATEKAEAEVAAAKAKADEAAKAAAAEANRAKIEAAERAKVEAAEQTRKEAAEKAKAEAERLRREAAEKAKTEAAEKARLAAEAERARKEVAEKEKTEAARAKKEAAEKAKVQGTQGTIVALVTPPAEQPGESKSFIDARDIAQLMQLELRRVGCLTGNVDGDWDAGSQRALASFNKHAGTSIDAKKPDRDALQAIRGKSGRVCPIVCESGYHAEGNRCVATSCKRGYVVGDDGHCEKRSVKEAARPSSTTNTESNDKIKGPGNSGVFNTGQVVCGRGGCDTIKPGCRLKHDGSSSSTAASGGFSGELKVVCQ